MNRLLLFLSLFSLYISGLSAQVQSPDAFLPTAFGETFTPRHLHVDYYQYVASQSPRVILEQYGSTNEKRPLLLAFVSTPENLAQLDDIRKNNLAKTGLTDEGTNDALDKAIIWLSFSVHGNEAGAAESALSTLYELAREDRPDVEQWLENTIVILDPCINPDGNARYTHWYRSVANQLPSPETQTREHKEPWPGGRVNHYLFDLNRDWAWQTQIETQQRLVHYHDWMPHIHVDFHEQYPNNPYFFAPAAAPFHEYISEWQRAFQFDIGKNHARHFDQNGWLYFTREIFDLLYPSYGDTYPMFHGAIGMTHEQAGHGLAGRAYIMENGDTLTLQDRIDHHTTAALSNIEVTAKNAATILQEFENYYKKALQSPRGKYRSYVIKASNPSNKLRALCQLLDKNKIEYFKAESPLAVDAYDYFTQTEGKAQVNEGDLVISAHQPFSVMVQVLFDPTTYVEDSLTYDITAWALPYAYGLDAFATTQRIEGSSIFSISDFQAATSDNNTYAVVASWNSFADAQFLSALLRAGIKVRYAKSAFTVAGQSYPRGTLVITRADNRKNSGWLGTLNKIARQQQKNINPVMTGFADQGADLGSDAIAFLQPPKVAILSGNATSHYSFGETWFFFEQALQYPADIYDANQMGQLPLENYNTLVLPEGNYSWNEATLNKIKAWVNKGGRIIAQGRAVGSLAAQDGFSIKMKDAQQQEEDFEDHHHHHSSYAGQARRDISNSIPGAIFKVQLDDTHPLAFGFDGHYFTLKTRSSSFELLKNGWNAGYLDDEPKPIGFAGSNALKRVENSLIFGIENQGAGSIIYLVDNPLFRGFWNQGKCLFSNALFFAQ
jgi:hypothetical protein